MSPSARCAAAGGPASCGEIMYSTGVANPIAAWGATVFHAGLFMDPTSLLVGGGQVAGGPAVMDSGEAGGLLVGPVVFPKGSYNGPLWLANEYPDPRAACQSSGQGSPSGRPIFVWVPGGTLSGFTLTTAGGQRVTPASRLAGFCRTRCCTTPRTPHRCSGSRLPIRVRSRLPGSSALPLGPPRPRFR
ncbi:MAG: hypothetical protein WKF42_09110 [Solirubrobacteraceae bacterium]